jgi:hypothetical protein
VPRREGWLAAVLIFVMLAGVHYDVIFLGRSLVLTNHSNPLDYRFLTENYGQDFVPFDVWSSRNLWPYANIRDAGGPWWQWEPDSQFLRRAMELREWPFWDPYVGAGTPAMANLTPGYFFPPYTALVALGASVPLKNGYFLGLLWCAGFFTFLFLRRTGLTFLSCLSGGAIVLMSGGLNQHIGTIALQSAAWLPLALYVTRLFLDAPTGRRTISVAITYAAIALASFPPILVWVFGFTALYALVAIVLGDGGESRRVRAGLALRWFVVTSLSTGLVGFYYLPALTLREAVPYVVIFYENAAVQSMPLVNACQDSIEMSPFLTR